MQREHKPNNCSVEGACLCRVCTATSRHSTGALPSLILRRVWPGTPVSSQPQEGPFNGPKRSPAAGGRHKCKRWLVINAIHSELRFLTWIFQASSADRTAKWQLGRSRQLSYVTAQAELPLLTGQPPPLHTYGRWLMSLLGSQMNPGMHKAAQVPPRHTGSGNISPQQHRCFHWMPLPCSESRYDGAGPQCPSNSCTSSPEGKKW